MITNTLISQGDQLGAQMSTFANLYYLARKNNQDLVLLEELKMFRRGYQILETFDIHSIQLIKKAILFNQKYAIYIVNSSIKIKIGETETKECMVVNFCR